MSHKLLLLLFTFVVSLAGAAWFCHGYLRISDVISGIIALAVALVLTIVVGRDFERQRNSGKL